MALRRIATALLLAGLIAAHTAQADVMLNFVDAGIDQVAKAVGAATGKTIIVDPHVEGRLNLVSERPVSENQALKTLQSALRMQGFSLVQDHGVLKVVPEADAKVEGVPTYIGNAPSAHGDQVVTQIFRLRYESANNLLPVLRPLISPSNMIAAYPSNNTIVVTDYADNVRRIAQIIAGVDSAAGQQVQVVELKNANAIDVARQMTKMLDPGSIGNTDATLKVSVQADPRTNSLMLRASNAVRLAEAKSLAKQLDAATRRPGNIHVVQLRGADAGRLAKTLRRMLGKGGNDLMSTGGGNAANSFNQGMDSSASTPGQPPLPGGSLGGSSFSSMGSNRLAGGGNNGGQGNNAAFLGEKEGGDGEENQPGGVIQADPETNSLIITASDAVYGNLRSVIDQLDVRRAQIYIEALIVELSATTNANLGIQWQGALLSNGRNNGLYGSSNFNSNGSQGIVNLTAQGATIANDPAPALATKGADLLNNGLNVGLLHRFGDVFGLGGLLQALSQSSDANVLSTPNLIALNNEEAKIVVGSNVPVVTGSYATPTANAATSVTAFNTFDRQDVGIVLRVKPQITDGGIIKLQIYSEASSVDSASTNNQGGVTISKRSVQSTVLADDGEIIVLGGLIEDKYANGNSKVPLLGDVPWIGQLFRSEQKSREKTNLMIFLRPVIIDDRDKAQAVTSNRYDYIQGVQGAYRQDNNLMKDDDPVVPQKPVGQSQDGSTLNLFDLDKMRRQ
ncbi:MULTISPECIES: type II secretion system secretin GspD [unclassified Paraburkholderia]|uniref:type II secretion system secretin GspD n=1 Tax=unclassified Paraburkholderia TaxID=2615204 RepID=UPI0020B879E6|nr:MULTISPECIES: type II secretion system secretin GspD [unclassified Paraburkholderia]MCP3721278.1 type II secretion system secretin GspD [Paraburkholderia sp. CNPSo 3281]MCX5544949.1 type II secretion system secretin GspD [Paraburkholderia sp. CNPSo 3076]